MRWPVDAPVSQAFGSNPTNNIRPGSVDYWIIQQFGNYQPNGHTGVDFPVRVGTPVGAAASGTVLHEGWMGGTYADNPWWIAPAFAGICVVIDHGSFIGIYGHMSSTSVNVGDYVTEGEVIGLSGNTGGSTGPHLHFEVLPDGWDFNNGMFGRVNPAQFISANASMGPAGTITPAPKPDPVEEDDMFNDEDRRLLKAVKEALIDGGKSMLYGASIQKLIDDIPRRTAFFPVIRDGEKVAWIQDTANGVTMLEDLQDKVLPAMAEALKIDPATVRSAFEDAVKGSQLTVTIGGEDN